MLGARNWDWRNIPSAPTRSLPISVGYGGMGEFYTQRPRGTKFYLIQTFRNMVRIGRQGVAEMGRCPLNKIVTSPGGWSKLPPR